MSSDHENRFGRSIAAFKFLKKAADRLAIGEGIGLPVLRFGPRTFVIPVIELVQPKTLDHFVIGETVPPAIVNFIEPPIRYGRTPFTDDGQCNLGVRSRPLQRTAKSSQRDAPRCLQRSSKMPRLASPFANKGRIDLAPNPHHLFARGKRITMPGKNNFHALRGLREFFFYILHPRRDDIRYCFFAFL